MSAHGAELADSTSWHSPNVIGSLRLAEDHLDRLMTTLRERAGPETRLTRGFFPPLWDARSLRLNHFSRAEVTWRTSDIEIAAGDERVQFECEGPEFAGESGAGRTSLEGLRAVGGTVQASILASAELVRSLGRAADGLAESPLVEGETARRTGRVIGQDDLAGAVGCANPANAEAAQRHARLLTRSG